METRPGAAEDIEAICRVETEARELGVDAVDLVVLAENDVGRGFYEGHGYEVVGEREDAIEESVRELVYEKSL